MNARARAVLVGVVVCLSAIAALAQTFATGDLVVGSTVTGIGFDSNVDWYRSGVLVKHVASLGNTPVSAAFDSSGNLYVGTHNDVLKFNQSGDAAGTFASGFAGADVQEILFDASGSAYVVLAADQLRVRKYSASGTPLASYSVLSPAAPAIVGADLAADQCTLYFTTAGVPNVHRYDLCADAPLADFGVTLPDSSVGRLRILPDGSVLVGTQSGAVLISSAGPILQQYTFGPPVYPFRAVSLDPIPGTFWAGVGGAATRVALADGSALSNVPVGRPIAALAVVGEPHAALAAAPSVPLFSPTFVILLTVIVAAGGVFRLR